MSIIIRPYRDADWPRLCAIHDAARQTELALAGAAERLSPPGDRRPAGGAVQLHFAGSGARMAKPPGSLPSQTTSWPGCT